MCTHQQQLTLEMRVVLGIELYAYVHILTSRYWCTRTDDSSSSHMISVRRTETLRFERGGTQ
jgi:hypothetical protein